MRVEDAHYLDEASADLLAALARELDDMPWLVLVARRDAPRLDAQSPNVIHIEPGQLAADDTLALAEVATDAAPLKPHLLALAAERSSGNPQYLRDLLRAAAEGDGDELPESIEAAAMSRIDQLQPHDRTLVRRASVLGVRFHPRFLLHVLGDDVPTPDEATWRRLEPFFAVDPDGYLRFRRAIMRDAAYAGLAYRTRRTTARGRRPAVGARVRRDARRGRRHAVAALPPRGRARARLALRARGRAARGRSRRLRRGG